MSAALLIFLLLHDHNRLHACAIIFMLLACNDHRRRGPAVSGGGHHGTHACPLVSTYHTPTAICHGWIGPPFNYVNFGCCNVCTPLLTVMPTLHQSIASNFDCPLILSKHMWRAGIWPHCPRYTLDQPFRLDVQLFFSTPAAVPLLT